MQGMTPVPGLRNQLRRTERNDASAVRSLGYHDSVQQELMLVHPLCMEPLWSHSELWSGKYEKPSEGVASQDGAAYPEEGKYQDGSSTNEVQILEAMDRHVPRMLPASNFVFGSELDQFSIGSQLFPARSRSNQEGPRLSARSCTVASQGGCLDAGHSTEDTEELLDDTSEKFGDCANAAATVFLNRVLPSAGSFYHFADKCRPCALVHKNLCVREKDCVYCHFEHSEHRRIGKRNRARQKARVQKALGQIETGTSGSAQNDGD